jgi:hypothetical protein
MEDKDRAQYTESHAAMERMRTAVHRERTLEKTAANEAEMPNELLAIADSTGTTSLPARRGAVAVGTEKAEGNTAIKVVSAGQHNEQEPR